MDLYYHNRAVENGTAGAALAAPLFQTCYLFIACVLIKLIYPLPNRYAVTTVVALLSTMPSLS